MSSSTRLRDILIIRAGFSSVELCAALKVSQPQLSRYIKQSADQIIRIGSGKNTRYCLKREIAQIGSEINVYTISAKSKVMSIGKLYPVYPKGFYWQASAAELSALYDDLPYFMKDLRPSGYLGRLIPKLYPEWNFPDDITIWSAETTLLYLAHFGSDQIGNLVIGDLALQKALKARLPSQVRATPDYDLLATDLIKYGNPGSSAAGEQPKFMTKSSLVKFAKLDKNPISVRKQDLLYAEQLASHIFYAHDKGTRIIKSKKYLFYEILRFDRKSEPRNISYGRIGLISLASLDAEFCGIGANWSKIGSQLLKQKLIDINIYNEISLRQFYGELIGNNDMHSGNLSFFFEQQKILGLAPLYDMLPMKYMPFHENIINEPLDLSLPAMDQLQSWDKAFTLAVKFWKTITEKPDFSRNFKKVAATNLSVLSELKEVRQAI